MFGSFERERGGEGRGMDNHSPCLNVLKIEGEGNRYPFHLFGCFKN
jgi:hypothetical protein